MSEEKQANLQNELGAVQANRQNLLLEEFPEGPYGSARNEVRLDRVSPRQAGQASVSSYRDQNPIGSERKLPEDEPESTNPRGSMEGQN